MDGAIHQFCSAKQRGFIQLDGFDESTRSQPHQSAKRSRHALVRKQMRLSKNAPPCLSRRKPAKALAAIILTPCNATRTWCSPTPTRQNWLTQKNEFSREEYKGRKDIIFVLFAFFAAIQINSNRQH